MSATETQTQELSVEPALSQEAAAVLKARFRGKIRAKVAKALEQAFGEEAAANVDPELHRALFAYVYRVTHARHRQRPEDLVTLAKTKSPDEIYKEAAALPKAYPMHEATALIRKAEGQQGKRHDGMFAPGQWRRYYPMPKPSQDDLGAVANDIIRWLENNGFTDVDYIAGTCLDDRKQVRRIGRVLPNEASKQSFANDPERQGGNLMLVISRHPYDLIRMSTGRGWQSCMTRNGMYFDYVPKEVAAGSMVAYLISKNDPEILDPMSRVTIKPFKNQKGDVLMQAGPTYGLGSNLFKRSVQAVLDREYNQGLYGEFQMDRNVYDDGLRRHHRRVPPDIGTWSAEQWIEYLGLKVYEKQGEQVIKGDLNMAQYDLKTLPDFSAYHVEGTVDVSGNPLHSLKGCPKSVTGDVKARSCGLTSLAGCTDWIGGSLWAEGNQLTTLEGGPTRVWENYMVSRNQLTSLAGAPQRLKGVLDVANNQLASLDGAPEHVGKKVMLSQNQLTSLEGLPKMGGGGNGCHLDVSRNKLTSIEGLAEAYSGRGDINLSDNPALGALTGSPDIVRGSFFASSCGLASLEGGPSRVDREFAVNNNKLTTLKGAPGRIGRRLIASRNPLESLAGLPADVGQGIVLRQCGLTSLKGMPAALKCSLDVQENQIADLDGMAERIEGDLDLSQNRLTSVKGIAQVVEGDLYLHRNQINSTRGMTRHIGRSLYLNDNRLRVLEGMPRKINHHLGLSQNRLHDCKGMPDHVGGDLYLQNTPMTDATNLPRHVGGTVDMRGVDTLQHLPARMPEGCRLIALDRDHLRPGDLPSRQYPPNDGSAPPRDSKPVDLQGGFTEAALHQNRPRRY